MKLWWHKLTHWEYWSANIVYAPTFLLWVWYAIRFRSISFYKYSNPGIANGGLYGDSKFKFYKMLPKHLFPETIFVDINNPINLKLCLEELNFNFPLIVKPDLGCRGRAVQKAHNLEELTEYKNSMHENFLIQRIIDWPEELGLFYCRIPNQNKGHITGLTFKRFLTITGNGSDTIEQLLRNNPRFEIQIPQLQNKIDLSEVLKNDEKRCLVPYGNHSRGTEFLNGSQHITDKLERTFDEIFNNLKGCYYGRLDIRFNTFKELEEGRNFSIIEFNGAKSEPTHIYDTSQGFWFGQREIFKHQKIFAQIISISKRINFK